MQVDFYTGLDETFDVAFSFQVYFGKYVVMNSLKGNTWGREEKSCQMPFQEGAAFEVVILALQNKYQVSTPRVNPQLDFRVCQRPQCSLAWSQESCGGHSLQLFPAQYLIPEQTCLYSILVSPSKSGQGAKSVHTAFSSPWTNSSVFTHSWHFYICSH